LRTTAGQRHGDRPADPSDRKWRESREWRDAVLASIGGAGE
jgi:hypothetical protein